MAKLPPPVPAVARRLVPTPPSVDIDAAPFDDVPTVVKSLCPGCTGPIDLVDESIDPPGSYGEFLGPAGGQGPGRCRGNARWFVCREPTVLQAPVGYLGLPGEGIQAVFADRRASARESTPARGRR